MSNRVREAGSRLLGADLRRRRGHRSLRDIERLSKSPPFANRVRPLSVTALNSIENGKQLPTIITLQTLSAIYSVPESHFLSLVKLEKFEALKPAEGDFPTLQRATVEAMHAGDFERAYATSLRLVEIAGDGEERATALGNRAIALWRMGYLQEAANQFLEILSDLDAPPRIELKALYNLCEVYRSMGNIFAAGMVAKEGLQLAERMNDQHEIAALLVALGSIKADTFERRSEKSPRLLRESVQHYEKAIRIFQALGSTADVAQATTNMGAAHILDGSLLLGFKYLRDGLELSRQIGNRSYIAYALLELGKAYIKTKDWPSARTHLLEAERIAARFGYPDYQFLSYFYLYEVEKAEGQAGDFPFRKCLTLRSYVEGNIPEVGRFDKYVARRVAGGGMTS